LNKALTNNPTHLPSQMMFVELDLRAGRLAAAEKRALELRAKNPGPSNLSRLLGTVYMAQKKPAAAIMEFKAALALERNGPNTLALFQAYIEAGDSKAAIDMMQAWLREHPQDMAAQSALAEAYLRAGQLQQARTAYLVVLKSNPKNVGALNNLANILFKLNEAQALTYAQQAYSLAPGDANVADTLGWILVHQGDPQKALPYLRDASLRASQNSQISYHLAEALYRLGRKTEAKNEIRKALSIGKDFEGIEEARKLSNQL
jgi:cellulose synthase operon protein C